MNLPPRSASLAPFFTPRGVAVIGASRDPSKLSYGVVRNLVDPQDGFPGPVYPVNPKADEILGRKCYPDIASVPDPVDLAVLILPAGLIPAAVEACGQRGVKAAVVISGGFREVGPEGAVRERHIVEIAERYGVRLMGPNGIGVIDTHTPVNTTFVRGMPRRGHIAFLSQSGALCGGIIDWIIGRGIGFSRLLSVGNEADVNETDALPFLAADEVSRVITLYLEDIKGGPAFVEALRNAAAVKPILVIKSGRTASGQAATASHTGALAGVHAPFRAACKQTGVIEVESIQGMFNAALALAYQPLLAGSRLAIVTNSGGPAALAADAMEAAGLTLAHTSLDTQQTIRKFVHPDAQVAGPVDMLGGADEHTFRGAVEAVLKDPANDGLLTILVPTLLVNPAAVVEAIAAAGQAAASAKPILMCLMGEASLAEAYQAARRNGIPAYTFPEDAIEAFGVLYQRARWLGRHCVPAPSISKERERARGLACAALATARTAGRMGLDAAEGRAVLEAYGLSIPPDRLATSAAEAAGFATQMGYPVALKLASPDILHKTDVGGVILSVTSEDEVRAGYEAILGRAQAHNPQARLRGVQVQKMISGGREVIVGVKRDPTFGPLVMFGLGGVYVEALADVSFRLAPLTTLDAEEMIGEVRSARLLGALRGAPPADRAALVDAIVRIGQLAADLPEIAELDVNPLLVLPAGQGAWAADCRIVLS